MTSRKRWSSRSPHSLHARALGDGQLCGDAAHLAASLPFPDLNTGNTRLGVKTLFIEPGSPWENGYVESLNGKPRDELLDREVFGSLLEARVLIERWREHYNTVRPHSSLGYRPPAPEAIAAGPPSASLRTAQQRRAAVGTLI